MMLTLLALALVLPGPSQRNVLVLLADDIGTDYVDFWGDPGSGPTPNIDALAAAGVNFTQAWSHPVCSPTRSEILTGRYGFRTGIGTAIAFGSSSGALELEEVTLAEVLSCSGYRTAAIGKWHLSNQTVGNYDHPVLQGFEVHCGTIGSFTSAQPASIYFDWNKNVASAAGNVQVPDTRYATSAAVDDALSVIEAFGDEPWFVWLAFNAPHKPFHAPPPGLHSQALPPGPIGQNEPAYMRAVVEAMDTEIGRLLGSIEPDVLAQTTIIFAGDNGTVGSAKTSGFPGMAKGSLFEGGVHVPLIVAGGGVTPGECDALVGLVDIFATVLKLADLPAIPSAVDSVPMARYLRDAEQPSSRAWIFSERFLPNGPGPYTTDKQAISDGRWKIIRDRIAGTDAFYDLAGIGAETNDLLPNLTPEQQAEYDALSAALDALILSRDG